MPGSTYRGSGSFYAGNQQLQDAGYNGDPNWTYQGAGGTGDSTPPPANMFGEGGSMPAYGGTGTQANPGMGGYQPAISDWTFVPGYGYVPGQGQGYTGGGGDDSGGGRGGVGSGQQPNLGSSGRGSGGTNFLDRFGNSVASGLGAVGDSIGNGIQSAGNSFDSAMGFSPGYFDAGGPGYVGYGTSPRSAADLALMASQQALQPTNDMSRDRETHPQYSVGSGIQGQVQNGVVMPVASSSIASHPTSGPAYAASNYQNWLPTLQGYGGSARPMNAGALFQNAIGRGGIR